MDVADRTVEELREINARSGRVISKALKARGVRASA
jgi:hypothetical protein